MVSTMVVIKHGLRFEPVGGSPLPIGKGLLNIAAIQKGIMYLRSVNLYPFNDGRYHATINTHGFAEILSAFSEHDATEAGFEVVADDQSKKFIFAGLRWETNYRESDLKIFGPKSNPDNPFVIDLINPSEVENGE
jgi:hypothetical protein